MILFVWFARLVCFVVGHREPVYLTCPEAEGPVPYCLRCKDRGRLP